MLRNLSVVFFLCFSVVLAAAEGGPHGTFTRQGGEKLDVANVQLICKPYGNYMSFPLKAVATVWIKEPRKVAVPLAQVKRLRREHTRLGWDITLVDGSSHWSNNLCDNQVFDHSDGGAYVGEQIYTDGAWAGRKPGREPGYLFMNRKADEESLIDLTWDADSVELRQEHGRSEPSVPQR